MTDQSEPARESEPACRSEPARGSEKPVDRPGSPSQAGIELGVTSRLCLSLHFLAQWFAKRHLGLVARMIQLGNRILTGADIDITATVSRGAMIPHTIGIVIGATAVVESGAVLMPHVVLGATAHTAQGRRHPHIGRDASIGTGAVLLGPIVIGAGAKVRANAVVVKDVPPGATVVGIPAKPVGRSDP